MGLTAEEVQRKYNVSREDSDHSRIAAIRTLCGAGVRQVRRRDLPVEVEANILENGAAHQHKSTFQKDEGPSGHYARSAGEVEAVFQADGTGDCRQLIADERWRGRGVNYVRKKSQGSCLKPMARFVSFRGGRCSAGDYGHRTVVAIRRRSRGGFEDGNID